MNLHGIDTSSAVKLYHRFNKAMNTTQLLLLILKIVCIQASYCFKISFLGLDQVYRYKGTHLTRKSNPLLLPKPSFFLLATPRSSCYLPYIILFNHVFMICTHLPLTPPANGILRSLPGNLSRYWRSQELRIAVSTGSHLESSSVLPLHTVVPVTNQFSFTNYNPSIVHGVYPFHDFHSVNIMLYRAQPLIDPDLAHSSSRRSSSFILMWYKSPNALAPFCLLPPKNHTGSCFCDFVMRSAQSQNLINSFLSRFSSRDQARTFTDSNLAYPKPPDHALAMLSLPTSCLRLSLFILCVILSSWLV